MSFGPPRAWPSLTYDGEPCAEARATGREGSHGQGFIVGLDVHKASISVSVAEEGRDGAVSFVGTIPNTPAALTKLAKRLGKDGRRLEFC
jgi:hypothetical protein